MYSELGERFPWQAPVVEQAAAVYFRGPKNCIHAQFYLIVLTPLERLHHPVVLCCLGWIFFVYASSCTGQEGKMLHGMCKLLSSSGASITQKCLVLVLVMSMWDAFVTNNL